jgi:hypothetical protein
VSHSSFTCHPIHPTSIPIEQAWSKLKQPLRGVKARLLDRLEPAIAAITPQNAQAFFRHWDMGYSNYENALADRILPWAQRKFMPGERRA